jgi:hypothetical protein
MTLPPTPPFQRVDHSWRSALHTGARPPRPLAMSASQESSLQAPSQQLLKLGCLLLLTFLLVACGSTPATHTLPPTATPVPTPPPIATALPTPTISVPTTAPDPGPYWTLTPNQLVLTSPECSRVGANAECVLKITYDSKGAAGTASWTAAPLNSYGLYLSTSPTHGTMTPPKQSVQVRVEISNFAFFCRLPTGDSIRFSFIAPVPESDHDVGVSCK